ncbi:MAG: DUF4124 domain-containing protein [Rhodocyclaceae bacterium]|jgi:hypothetical protein|nr:DUF4124 domain-containing protein [Rhodocyclaceae bacterium]
MRRWLLVLLAGLALQAQAQGGLYKWIDEKGVVHYSDKPPAGKAGEKLKAKSQPPLDAASSPQRSRSWQEQLQDSNERRYQEEKQQKEAQQKAQEAEQKCLRARNALDTLKREMPLYRVNKEGERDYMADEERRRLIAGWQQQADAHCK